MIAHLQGQVAEKFLSSVILDVGGVGYEILLAKDEAERLSLGDEVKLYTFHLVREQSEDLFGFVTLAGKKLFELLITVQGIGPKNAINILSLGSAESVRNAIANADSAFISKATGVGKKSAERVIINLSDKVGLPAYYGRANDPESSTPDRSDEALEALIALGFPLAEASAALSHVDPALPVADRIRLALKK